MTVVWMIASMAVISAILRISFTVGLQESKLPAWLRQALNFVPVAVLPALVVPAVLQPSDGDPSAIPFRVGATLVAGLVSWRRRSMPLAIVSGLVCFWLLQAAVEAVN